MNSFSCSSVFVPHKVAPPYWTSRLIHDPPANGLSPCCHGDPEWCSRVAESSFLCVMMTKAFPRQSCEITHLSQTSSLHLSPLIRSLWLYSSPQTLYSAANNVGFFPGGRAPQSRLEDLRHRSADPSASSHVCWLMRRLRLPAALGCVMCWLRDARGLMFKLICIQRRRRPRPN